MAFSLTAEMWKVFKTCLSHEQQQKQMHSWGPVHVIAKTLCITVSPYMHSLNFQWTSQNVAAEIFGSGCPAHYVNWEATVCLQYCCMEQKTVPTTSRNNSMIGVSNTLLTFLMTLCGQMTPQQLNETCTTLEGPRLRYWRAFDPIKKLLVSHSRFVASLINCQSLKLFTIIFSGLTMDPTFPKVGTKSPAGEISLQSQLHQLTALSGALPFKTLKSTAKRSWNVQGHSPVTSLVP